MTSKMKCPVCQKDLRKLFNRYTGEPNCDYECGNFDCELYGIEMPESVWKAVIQKLEDLKIARKALKNMSLGNVPSLPDDETLANAMCNYARDTLKQIEHKEQI